MYDRGSERFTYSSRVECPECKKLVHVGTGEYINLDARRATRTVSRRGVAQHPSLSRHPLPQLKGKTQSFLTSSKPQVPLNPLRGFDPRLSSTHPKSRALRPELQSPLETQLRPLVTMTPWEGPRGSKKNSVKEAFIFRNLKQRPIKFLTMCQSQLLALFCGICSRAPCVMCR